MRRSLVTELVPDASVANAVGLNSALMTGSRVIGPALAGILIAGPGAGAAFALNAVTYLAVIAALHADGPQPVPTCAPDRQGPRPAP